MRSLWLAAIAFVLFIIGMMLNEQLTKMNDNVAKIEQRTRVLDYLPKVHGND